MEEVDGRVERSIGEARCSVGSKGCPPSLAQYTKGGGVAEAAHERRIGDPSSTKTSPGTSTTLGDARNLQAKFHNLVIVKVNL